MTLRIWAPPELVLGFQENSSQPVTQTLSALLQEFEGSYPSLRFEVEPKSPYGLGGLAHLLITTHAAVPTQMPDLVLVDTAELPKLSRAGIPVAFEDVISPQDWEEFYPFARQCVTFQGKSLGLPTYTDLLIAVYNVSLVKEPPRTWTELMEIKSSYIFPMAEGDGSAADIFLLQYLAAGGTLGKERMSLNPTIMAGVLRNYREAMDRGVIPDFVRGLGTLETCWGVYLTGDAGMANVSSYQYQRDRSLLKRTRYTQIPTVSGKPLSLARTWAWIVTTPDPQRQEIAAQVALFLTNPEVLSKWVGSTPHLPVSKRALRKVVQDPAYYAFLEDLMQHAFPYPDLQSYSRIQPILIHMIGSVLNGSNTPEQAALAAAAQIAHLR
ncbi:MAG: extracellular solute-binding protein [Anaerolineae bacterium]|nr:extracellular solute-binding protein [Anaerolineae bacterium]